MNQKIDLYKEVLEIEPGSKIFFPLARLLVQENRIDDAIATLQHGLGRHPDHVEARLLLVETCFVNEKKEQASKEIQALGKIFKLYPKFWEAWSNVLAQTQELQDAALALRFFAAALAGKDLSWAHVIAQGLRDVLDSAPLEYIEPKKAPATKIKPASEILAPSMQEQEEATIDDEGPLLLEEKDDVIEEGFSLRTKSMADILAEQGDYAGALDIYQELIESGHGDTELLEKRADELRAMILAPTNLPHKEEKVDGNVEGDKNRLVNLLESLAERLENRSRSGL